jgi:hypothetical protein
VVTIPAKQRINHSPPYFLRVAQKGSNKHSHRMANDL